ncbi:enterobactin synthase subunit EntD [Shigella flexneri]|nr:enterobactin synthase subunit EntD [Escherichia coli]
MKTTHTALPFAGHTLHFVEFDPANFCEQDLLWLPHYAQLQHAGRKRKTEHLAGRIAAVHALREYGYKGVPAIGKLRQPVWPTGVYGSISHCGATALAVVSRQPIGIDIEEIFSAQTAAELTDNIITPSERKLLTDSGLAFSLALTLAFSAKESAFKASERQTEAGFLRYQIRNCQHQQMKISGPEGDHTVQWLVRGNNVITLCLADEHPHTAACGLPGR